MYHRKNVQNASACCIWETKNLGMYIRGTPPTPAPPPHCVWCSALGGDSVEPAPVQISCLFLNHTSACGLSLPAGLIFAITTDVAAETENDSCQLTMQCNFLFFKSLTNNNFS